MKQTIIVSTLGLLLSPALPHNAAAQTADTLKRQLQVETSEELILSERVPLSSNIQAPTIYTARTVVLVPSSLREHMPSLGLDPLRLMQAPHSFYYKRRQRGYVELAGGIKYNASLSAGIRAIDHEDKYLDLVVDGLYSNYEISSNKQNWNSQEQKFKVATQYRSLLNNSLQLSLDAGYAHHKYNYYGYIPLENSGNNYDPTSLIGKPFLVNNTYKFGLSIGQVEHTEGLTYNFRPELAYSQINGLGVWEQNRQSNEIKLKIAGLLKYHIYENQYTGLELSATNYWYNRSAEKVAQGNAHTYSNKSLLSLKPHWSYRSEDNAELEWAVKLGLALDFYQEYNNKGLLLSPYIKAYVKPNDKWNISLDALGGMSANSLSEMLSEMPYLRILYNTPITQIPLDIRLSSKGLLTPQLGLEGFIQYVSYTDAINYHLVASGDANSELIYDNAGSPTSPLNHQGAFITERANGSVFRIGAGINYHFTKQLTLNSRLTYNRWSRENIITDTPALYGRPSLEVDASLTYRPNKFVELIGGYELRYGTRQKVNFLNTPKIVSLPTISLFRFSAAYNINSAWSIKGSAHILSNANATMYYGYMPQRLSATLGISYCF